MRKALLCMIVVLSGCMVHRDSQGRVVGVTLNPSYRGPEAQADGRIESAPANHRGPQYPRQDSSATTASRTSDKAKTRQRPSTPPMVNRDNDDVPVVVGGKRPSSQSAGELAASIGGDPNAAGAKTPPDMRKKPEGGSKLETIPVSNAPAQQKQGDLPAW